MKNIRLFIIASSLVITTWLTASYFADTYSDNGEAFEPSEKAELAVTQ